MKVLIAGGAGFLGRALTKSLLADGHQVWILTRNPRASTLPAGAQAVAWDGHTLDGWGERVEEVDAMVNLCGESLSRWPWTARQKQRFLDSRIYPGLALAEAVRRAARRPEVFLQQSGINHYGLRGGEMVTEATPPAEDFLARLTVAWEDSTKAVEEAGVRRVVTRSAVVLSSSGGLLPFMALPVRLFFGGRLGSGAQSLPWIHLADEIGAMRFLLENRQARGAFNLIAPHATSNAEFVRLVARALQRPYWFPTPAFALRLAMGEMSNLILEGRFAHPARLLEHGYQFRFARLEAALADLFAGQASIV